MRTASIFLLAAILGAADISYERERLLRPHGRDREAVGPEDGLQVVEGRLRARGERARAGLVDALPTAARHEEPVRIGPGAAESFCRAGWQ